MEVEDKGGASYAHLIFADLIWSHGADRISRRKPLTATIIFVSHAGWYAHTASILLSEAALAIGNVYKLLLLIHLFEKSDLRGGRRPSDVNLPA